jgi:hypothetical protein
MSEWWENPVVRMPRFNSLPISMKIEELGSRIAVEEVVFKREQWVNPCDIAPKFKEYSVKGVTGAKYWNGDWFFYGWRCQRCKANFIVGDWNGLRHECTNPSQ